MPELGSAPTPRELFGALRRHVRSRSWASDRRVVLGAAVCTVAIATGAVALATGSHASAPATAEPVAVVSSSSPGSIDAVLPVGSLIRAGTLPDPVLAGDTGTVGVPAGTAPVAPRPDLAAVPTRARTISTYQGAAGTMTPAGIATLALQQGCAPDSAAIATAVAMAESGGSPGAQGDIGLMTSVWDWSAGLWQIRGLHAQRGSGGLRDSVANQGAQHNAAAMYAISGSCTTWSPWSTYTRGTYQQFMTVARGAVDYVLGYRATHANAFPPVAAPDAVDSVPSQGAGDGQPVTAASARPTSRPTSRPSTSASSRPAAGSTHRTPARSSTPAAPAPTTAAPTPTPSSSSSAEPVLPLPSLPTLPLPSISVPKLPLPTLSLPVSLPVSIPGLPIG